MRQWSACLEGGVRGAPVLCARRGAPANLPHSCSWESSFLPLGSPLSAGTLVPLAPWGSTGRDLRWSWVLGVKPSPSSHFPATATVDSFSHVTGFYICKHAFNVLALPPAHIRLFGQWHPLSKLEMRGKKGPSCFGSPSRHSRHKAWLWGNQVISKF